MVGPIQQQNLFYPYHANQFPLTEAEEMIPSQGVKGNVIPMYATVIPKAQRNLAKNDSPKDQIMNVAQANVHIVETDIKGNLRTVFSLMLYIFPTFVVIVIEIRID